MMSDVGKCWVCKRENVPVMPEPVDPGFKICVSREDCYQAFKARILAQGGITVGEPVAKT